MPYLMPLCCQCRTSRCSLGGYVTASSAVYATNFLFHGCAQDKQTLDTVHVDTAVDGSDSDNDDQSDAEHKKGVVGGFRCEIIGEVRQRRATGKQEQTATTVGN